MLTPKHRDCLAHLLPELTRDSDFWRALGESGHVATLDAGQTICSEGSRCEYLALVLAGTARVYKLGESGREITLYRVHPGECCILTASCILSRRPFPAFAMSEAPTTAVLLPAPLVAAWMSEQPAWRDYVWDLLAGRLADVISLIEEVAFRRLDERLAEYLLTNAGVDNQLQATHQRVAADLGTSREVVSRILKDFEARGLVALGRGSIEVLEPAAMRTLVNVT